MQSKGKIGTFQLFALLTVSRLLSTLTFIPSFDFRAGVSDCILSTLLGGILLWAVCLPLLHFLKNNGENNLISVCASGKKTVSLVYCFYLFFLTLFTSVRLMNFISSVFFPSVNTELFTVLTVAAICYCASFQLEATARAGTLSLFLLAVSLAVIFFSLKHEFRANNLSPLFYYGAAPTARISAGVLVRSSEPVIIYLLADRVSGNIRRGLKIWLIVITLIITSATALLMLSLSDMALITAFPFHAMSQLSTLSVIERMDAVFTGIWIMSAFLKAVLFTVVFNKTLCQGFEKVKEKTALPFFGAAVTAAMLICQKSFKLMSSVSSIGLREILFAVFTVIIPCSIIINHRIKRRIRQ